MDGSAWSLTILPFIIKFPFYAVFCQTREKPYNSSCYADYMEKNGACIPCPPGTYGDNCSSACPTGYYGSFCTEKCNCLLDDFCSPIHGCLSLKQYETFERNETHDNSTTGKPDQESSHISYKEDLYILVGTCSALLVLLTAVVLVTHCLCSAHGEPSREKIQEDLSNAPQQGDICIEKGGEMSQGLCDIRFGPSLPTTRCDGGLETYESVYDKLELRVKFT